MEGQEGGASRPHRRSVGLVAGRGAFPLEVCRGMRRAGISRIAVVAVRGDASERVASLADSACWLYPGQLAKTIRWFRSQRIDQVVFAGQITPGRLFRGLRPDLSLFRLLRRLAERNAESIFSAVSDEFARHGIAVLPSLSFMEDSLAPAGWLTRRRPSKTTEADIAFAVRMARRISGLDIGQTVVVRRGTVLAVEGFEGTDAAIRRGGKLGRGRIVVAKVAKPNHDVRFDVPCVGMTTVESLKAANAKALVVQAGRTLLLEKARFLNALETAGIAAAGVLLEDACGESTSEEADPAGQTAARAVLF